jgi:hypothetical protein
MEYCDVMLNLSILAVNVFCSISAPASSSSSFAISHADELFCRWMEKEMDSVCFRAKSEKVGGARWLNEVRGRNKMQVKVHQLPLTESHSSGCHMQTGVDSE